MNNFESLIGYKFNNPYYLERALTHSSYNREKNTKHEDNERLEFLGDAFFDAIVSAELFKRMPDVSEGKLTKTRAQVVCESSLAKAARKLELGKYIFIGHGEETCGGRDKDSILADAMEAVIGAIFIDGGFEQAQRFVLHAFDDTIKDAVTGKLFSDYKSELQELIQKNGKNESIRYLTVNEEGPAHDKTFYISLFYDGRVIGTGKGKNKKEAEQRAAKSALVRIRGDI